MDCKSEATIHAFHIYIVSMDVKTWYGMTSPQTLLAKHNEGKKNAEMCYMCGENAVTTV